MALTSSELAHLRSRLGGDLDDCGSTLLGYERLLWSIERSKSFRPEEVAMLRSLIHGERVRAVLTCLRHGYATMSLGPTTRSWRNLEGAVPVPLLFTVRKSDPGTQARSGDEPAMYMLFSQDNPPLTGTNLWRVVEDKASNEGSAHMAGELLNADLVVSGRETEGSPTVKFFHLHGIAEHLDNEIGNVESISDQMKAISALKSGPIDGLDKWNDGEGDDVLDADKKAEEVSREYGLAVLDALRKLVDETASSLDETNGSVETRLKCMEEAGFG